MDRNVPLRPFHSLVSVRERETDVVWEIERETEVWVQSIEMDLDGGEGDTRPWVCVHWDRVGGMAVAAAVRVGRVGRVDRVDRTHTP